LTLMAARVGADAAAWLCAAAVVLRCAVLCVVRCVVRCWSAVG
jgi:hypothetical protein